MAPFYGWDSTASRPEPLRGDSLLFTTKFPKIPGTHHLAAAPPTWGTNTLPNPFSLSINVRWLKKVINQT